MTYDEFKNEFLATPRLESYKKDEEYISALYKVGTISQLVTEIKTKIMYSYPKCPIKIKDISIQEYRELKAFTMRGIKMFHQEMKLKQIGDDF